MVKVREGNMRRTRMYSQYEPQKAVWISSHVIFSAIILFHILGGLNLNGQSRVSERQSKSADEGRFVTVEGIRLHYLSKGAGAPVVFLHGNPGFVEDYARVLQIAEREFQAVAFDRPGHGLSQRPSHKSATPEEQAKLLHEALLKLGVIKPILVGHSWGGMLVLTYALRYPKDLSGIVLIAPAGYPEPSGFSFPNLLVHVPVVNSIMIGTFKLLIKAKIKRGLERAFAPVQVPKQYLKLAQRSWASTKAVKATIEDHESREQTLRRICSLYPTIDVPAVILTGKDDLIVNPVTDSYPLHRAIKDSRLIVVPHLGHEIPQSDPTAVMKAIELARHLASEQGDMSVRDHSLEGRPRLGP